MANPRIEVEIGAVIDGLKQGFGESVKIIDTLEKQAQDFEKALKNATSIEQISTLNVDLAKTRAALSQLRNAGLEPTAQSTEKLAKATSNYNSVGVDFARLIQDAPFGIIGVGNNITQLAGSFQNARNEGQSFTKILGGIFSSGNLLILGISALTTALTLYSQSSQGAVKNTDTLKDSYDDLADAAEEAAKRVAAIRFADDKIQEEIDKVLGLDSSFSLVGASAEQLTEITNRAFAKLDKEQLSAFGSSLNDLANNQLRTVGNELGLTREESIKFIQSLKGNDQAFESLNPKVRNAVGGYNRLSNQVSLVNQQLDFFKDKSDKAAKSVSAFDKFSDQWDQYNLGLEVSGILTNTLTESFDKLDEKILKVGESIIKSKTLENIEKIRKELGLIKEFDVKIPESPPQEDKPQQDTSPQSKFVAALSTLNEEFQAFGGDFTQRVVEFTENIKNIIQQNMFEAFVGVGEAIGSALARGENVIKAIGQSLLDSLSTFLGDLGRQLIAFGVAGTAFGTLLEAIKKGGPASIPAGLAAIAAGTALVAISSAIRNRASAGLSGGGSSVGASGVGGGTSFVGGAQGFGFNQNREIRGELVARGQDLVYVFNEANTRINKG